MFQPRPCKYCGQKTHTSLQCHSKPRKPLKNKKHINRIGPVAAKWAETRSAWIQANPPVDGYWECYLRISPMCLGVVDIYSLTLDHVKPRSTHTELRNELANLRPSCAPCNAEKGSRELEKLR